MSTIHIKSKTHEINIPPQKPFLNDKLDREKTGSILTDIVSFYGQSGCVMALNGEWGSGKTTFIKMWSQMLKNNGFKTLYFNAWNSDYTTDPLMAMISELKELSPTSSEINKIAGYGGRIILSVAKSVLKKTIGVDCDELNAVLSTTEDIGKEYLSKFAEQKENISDFKKDLKTFIATNAGEKPIIFFIDELDRCNPHYAVSVLERIKHLFDIPNIIFVLAINKKELSNAIQGYYGSTNINSEEYLHRFIDIEYSLPKPKMDDFCEYLYNEYGFCDFFKSQKRPYRVYDEAEVFKTMATKLAKHSNLRQLERIYAYARLALMQFSTNSYLIPDLYFLLCFWKITQPNFYLRIRNRKLSSQELLYEIESLLPRDLLITDNEYQLNRNIYFLIANLIFGYDTNVNMQTIQQILNTKQDNQEYKYEHKLSSSIMNNKLLNESLDYFYTKLPLNLTNFFEDLLDRIDLLDEFQIV